MKPLEGVKVLDLSHALSGPTCTQMLALLGADVVKIERPGVGDDFRHYTEHAGLPGMSVPFAATNTGKRSLTLDFKHPRAREVIHRLAKQSDLLVENFRPGVPKKFGLDYESLKAVNPGLVYCSISGFGQTGAFRDWTAYDHIVQAMSGIMWMSGEPDAGPLKVGFPMIDTFTGYMAVIGILAALRKRDLTGEGDFVDVAMLDSAFKLMGGSLSTYFYSGEMPKRAGNRGYRLVATADIYQTADGYIALGANHQHQIDALCRVLGDETLLDDPRFKTHKDRVENYEALSKTLADMFIKFPGAELEAKLSSAQVPVSIVRDMAQITAHPHFDERKVFLDAQMPGAAEPLKVVGPGFQMANAEIEAGAVPTLGQHTDDVLKGLGFTASEIASLRAEGAV